MVWQIQAERQFVDVGVSEGRHAGSHANHMTHHTHQYTKMSPPHIKLLFYSVDEEAAMEAGGEHRADVSVKGRWWRSHMVQFSASQPSCSLLTQRTDREVAPNPAPGCVALNRKLTSEDGAAFCTQIYHFRGWSPFSNIVSLFLPTSFLPIVVCLLAGFSYLICNKVNLLSGYFLLMSWVDSIAV